MRQRQQTAEAFQHYGPRGLVTAAEEAFAEPEQSTIHAENKEVSASWFGLAYFLTFLAVAVFATALKFASGWSMEATAMIGSVIFLLLVPIILMIASGDVPTLLDTIRRWRLKLQRMVHLETVYLADIDLEQQKSKWEHEENMMTARTDAELAEMRVRLQLIEDKAHIIQRPSDGPASPAYTPAKVGPERKMAADYVKTLYRRGLPDYTQVGKDGRLQKVPWSKRGEWPTGLKLDAYRQLVEPAPGAPPLVTEEHTDGKVTGYFLNVRDYPNKVKVYNVLGLG